MFDQLEVPVSGRLLEIGCGPAYLWKNNEKRLRTDWRIVLSDFSPGMLASAREDGLASHGSFQFLAVDAQSIPYPDRIFDVLIANHMLYHVPDRPKALSEIKRVLKPGSRLYAATNGEERLQELRERGTGRLGP